MFIEENRGKYAISLMCRLYGVTRAGYYTWRKRLTSQRQQDDTLLKQAIHWIHERSHETYGSPRIQKALAQVGRHHSRKRIARLMAAEGLEGRCMRVYRARPGLRQYFRDIECQDLSKATKPDQVWVGDVTYLKVGKQWRYLAVVMDWMSRRVIGWSLGSRRTVSLTLSALNRAVHNRHPANRVIFHSDRGIEYVGKEFKKRLARLRFTQSVNRPGKMNDNARMESFFGSMKSEWLYGQSFATDAALRARIGSYIPFYNQVRMHSSLGYSTPVECEATAN